MAKASSTRQASKVWLVGRVNDKISGIKLPTYREALSLFFHQHKVQKKTVRDSSTYVVREVLTVWENARIPTTIERNAIKKLEVMYEKFVKLKKNSKRTTKTQKANEDVFNVEMDKLFDIAHANALSMIKIQEDVEFLKDQRGERKGYMQGVDKALSRKEQRRDIRMIREQELRQVEEERKGRQFTQSTLTPSSESDQPEISDKERNVLRVQKRTKKRKAVNIVTPELASALDRTNVSDRKATYILTAAAQSLGHDASNLAINPSTIRRYRAQHRANFAQTEKEHFSLNIPVTLHWDGKLLPDITGRETVDRICVVISGYEMEKLLGVPKISDGRASTTCECVVKTLSDWEIKNEVKALSFDTTAVNTGKSNGVCTRLEKELGRNLLHLACRHHVLEVVIADVFLASFGPSSGPDIGLFKRFQRNWHNIDITAFSTAQDDEILSQILSRQAELKEKTLTFAVKALQLNKLPRDDYRELLELTVIFLGGTPPRGTRFMAPGAMHRARWMAKVIYSLKVWMFKTQYRLTTREEKSVRNISLFTALIYTKAWISSPLAIEAPVNDLELLKSLVNYRYINETIAEAALKAFSRHLWYLSEELVALAFFSSSTRVETKVKMVQALNNPSSQNHPKRIEVKETCIQTKQLEDFVTENTLNFFKILDLPFGFLQKDPKEWEDLDEYKNAKKYAKALRVVNDTAERGIQLIQDFNCSTTKNEEQKQFLLQVVTSHRAKFPKPKKSLLVGNI